MKATRITMWLAVLTGFWILLSESWTLLYKANLLLHPVVSLAAALFFFRIHKKRLSANATHRWVRDALIALILTVALGLARKSYPGMFWNFLLLGAYPAVLYRTTQNDFRAFLGRCSVYFFTSLLVSGLVFAGALGGRVVKDYLLLHRSTAGAFVTVVLLVLAVDIKKSAGGACSFSKEAMRSIKPIALTVALVLLGIVAVGGIDYAMQDARPYYKFHLSTYKIEDRADDEQDILPADFSRHHLGTKTESCGTAQCHGSLVEDMSISAHGTSMFTGHFQKNMELLAEEIGIQNQITCGGCHYPKMMFERTVPLSQSYREVNYSCTFCHQIQDVKLWEDRRKTDLAVRLHADHLTMFDHEGRDAISALDRLLVNLNPFGHGRVFTRDFYFEDKYCQVCHRLQIQASADTPLAKPRCIDCHMQPRNLLGLEGKERNHLFPGTNTVTPDQLNRPDIVSIILRFSNGELPLPVKGWGSFWEPRDHKGDKMIWIHQKAMPLNDPVPGQDFSLRIITINASVDHVFPGGPLDLVESWQKVTVRDQNGRVLFHVGDLDADWRIDPNAHRMGGYMMGMDGKLVDKNRVWQIKEKVVTRAIAFHTSTYDDYTFFLPEDVTELHIESAWLYRKLNQEFMDWAYGAGKSTVPTVVTAEMKAVIPVR